MQKIINRENGADKHQPLTWGISLDGDGSVVSIELVRRSALSLDDFLPAHFLSIPTQKRAAALVVAQYEPNGLRSPSEDEKRITEALIQCGKLVGIPLLDHLIISGEEHFSFRNAGLIEQLAISSTELPLYTRRAEIEQKLKDALDEKERLMLTIADLMQEAGRTIEEIADETGFSVPLILRLQGLDEMDINQESELEAEPSMD